MGRNMKLSGKVIVVTGAGSGIGRELTLDLLRRGARVAGVDISTQGMAETGQLANGSAENLATFSTDIADRAAVEALVQQVLQRFQVVDGLINCAGIIQPFVKVNDLDYSTLERVFDVNFRGTLYMTKAFLPLFLQRPEAHIVNVSSTGGFLPVPGQTAYGASKAAVKLLTEGLSSELSDSQVHVTLVYPGSTNTNIAQNSGVDVSRLLANANLKALGTASAASTEILDGVERNRPRIMVGREAKFLDAIYRLNPVRASMFIAKQMKALLPL
jgi:NAD(P)-dependent dehydrogenase (short-subunit alcohol dehydrogenase family)